MTISECNSPVAENIQQIIRENGLKQTYIAEKAGYTTQIGEVQRSCTEYSTRSMEHSE